MDIPYYPINDYGPMMKGLVIGGLGIFHVFLAQFAIGGGMLMCYFQRLAQTGRMPLARRFIDGYFKLLVLISFVLGAVTGVGMWLTSIQISPRTIGLMVDEFHWIWAVEWTFFCLEVVAGYLFYRYGKRLSDPVRFRLLVLYSLAAWFSLFWINGILSWQLTPGAWETGHVWAGFWNPSFLPSLAFRTVVSMTLAALVACVVVNIAPDLDRSERTQLIHRSAHFLAPMLLMPLLGLWYFASIPEESRGWVMGKSVPMTLFMNLGVGASALIGAYAIVIVFTKRLYVNAATATLLVALAFLATAGGEFVREGVRKPFTVRGTLYSHAVTPAEVRHLREVGTVAGDPWPLVDGIDYANPQLAHGAKVYRFHCGICHTLEGMNGLVHLTERWGPDLRRQSFAKLQRLKSFMPPFSGTPEDLEALVQYVGWQESGRPAEWAESHDPAVLAQIAVWLDEAGTEPGYVFNKEPSSRER